MININIYNAGHEKTPALNHARISTGLHVNMESYIPCIWTATKRVYTTRLAARLNTINEIGLHMSKICFFPLGACVVRMCFTRHCNQKLKWTREYDLTETVALE